MRLAVSQCGNRKEHTNYWARVLARFKDAPMAVEVLGDMISASLIDPEEI